MTQVYGTSPIMTCDTPDDSHERYMSEQHIQILITDDDLMYTPWNLTLHIHEVLSH